MLIVHFEENSQESEWEKLKKKKKTTTTYITQQEQEVERKRRPTTMKIKQRDYIILF